MRYRFDVNLTDEEYFKFNMFVQTKSENGRKTILLARFLIVLVASIFLFAKFSADGFGYRSIIFMIITAIFILIFQLKYIDIIKWTTRKMIESYKKQGKFTYSPTSVIEFDDERIYETTDESKIEQTLSNVECVSVCESDKAIYICVNTAMTFVMPYRVFENDEQREEFIEFLRRKCNKVEVHLK